MLWSKTFIPTLRETPQEAESVGHQLLLRAGFIRMLMAGAYSYLPLGFRVLNNIQDIIRQELDSCSAAELLLPALQPLELWQRTGRDKDIGEVMFRFIDRRGRKVCLGPTHEEVITDLVRNHISSYKQLPVILYQIQTKFRDEIRPRFGLIRACEFIMKDAYSFDRDEEGLDRNYKAMYEAYQRIFRRLGLKIVTTEADSGVMGGKVSHEFMVPAADGEDTVLVCPKCAYAKAYTPPAAVVESKICEKPQEKRDQQDCPKCSSSMDKVNCIEVGHVFKLGTKYSASLGANFLDAQGQSKQVIMGCYGIGVSRLISSVIEQNFDKDGIIWPKEVAPYKAVILALDVTNKEIMETALSVYKTLRDAGVDVLLDDRDERAGVKFKDADLLGIPLQVIIGKESIKGDSIELKIRRTQEKLSRPKEKIRDEIARLV
ncbi:MAG: proline--tRNA ligase [Candidatus Omnitrophica bacterium]|nr:proline--tRNA ligase [Candidatus Omnitrophota bacterium]